MWACGHKANNRPHNSKQQIKHDNQDQQWTKAPVNSTFT